MKNEQSRVAFYRLRARRELNRSEMNFGMFVLFGKKGKEFWCDTRSEVLPERLGDELVSIREGMFGRGVRLGMSYVNDSSVNIPVSKEFMGYVGYSGEMSVRLNAMGYYTLVLLCLKRLEVLRGYVCDRDGDVLLEISSLVKMLTHSLHPSLKERLRNPGIGVTLNTFVGFDTEYELEKGLNRNRLLSTQLAGYTNAYVKISKIDTELKIEDFWTNVGKNGLGSCFDSEEDYVKFCLSSMEKAVASLRLSRNGVNDAVRENLRVRLKGYLSSSSKEFDLYVLNKSEVVTRIGYEREYGSEDLVRDSALLGNGNHIESLG